MKVYTLPEYYKLIHGYKKIFAVKYVGTSFKHFSNIGSGNGSVGRKLATKITNASRVVFDEKLEWAPDGIMTEESIMFPDTFLQNRNREEAEKTSLTN